MLDIELENRLFLLENLKFDLVNFACVDSEELAVENRRTSKETQEDV